MKLIFTSASFSLYSSRRSLYLLLHVKRFHISCFSGTLSGIGSCNVSMLLFESLFSIEVLLDFFLLIDLKPLVDDFVDFFRF